MTEPPPSMIERERRFLVDAVPDDLPVPLHVEQAYLSTSPAVRVRRVGDRYWLTIKTGCGRTRVEVERDLHAAEFAALWDEAKELRIDKRRYLVPLPCGLTAELDMFDGALAGHRIVEVEFPDDASADAFVPPAWFGLEITDDRRYTNARLARQGWPAEALPGLR